MNRWQSKLNDETLFTNLFIPGTHNSSMNSINYTYKTEDKCKQSGANFFIKHITRAYALCQENDIYDQLNDGVRYIDIRVTKWGGEYYTSHTYSSGKKVNDVLDVIYAFLMKNPTEFVFLNFKRDPENDLTTQELENIWNNHRLSGLSIYLYGTVKNLRSRVIRVDQRANNHWFNQSRNSGLQERINADADRKEGSLEMIQYVLTPSSYDIGVNIVSFYLSVISLILLPLTILSWYVLCINIPLAILFFLIYKFYHSSIKNKTKSINYKFNDSYNIIAMDYYTSDKVGKIIDKNFENSPVVINI